jgi:hypothetical protein
MGQYTQQRLTQVQYFKIATYLGTLVGDDNITIPYTPQHMVKHISDKFGLYTTAKQLRQMASDCDYSLQVSTANITRGPGAATVRMTVMETDLIAHAKQICLLTEQIKACANQIRLLRESAGVPL